MKTKTGSQLCPHVCKCGSACYRGAIDVECVNPLCHWYSEKTLIAFQREFMKGERAKGAEFYQTADDKLIAEIDAELDIGNEPTQPRITAIKVDGVTHPVASQPQQNNPATLDSDIWKKYVNAWAPMLGIKKLAGESDDQLRDRILDKLGYKPGARMIPVIKGID